MLLLRRCFVFETKRNGVLRSLRALNATKINSCAIILRFKIELILFRHAAGRFGSFAMSDEPSRMSNFLKKLAVPSMILQTLLTLLMQLAKQDINAAAFPSLFSLYHISSKTAEENYWSDVVFVDVFVLRLLVVLFSQIADIWGDHQAPGFDRLKTNYTIMATIINLPERAEQDKCLLLGGSPRVNDTTEEGETEFTFEQHARALEQVNRKFSTGLKQEDYINFYPKYRRAQKFAWCAGNFDAVLGVPPTAFFIKTFIEAKFYGPSSFIETAGLYAFSLLVAAYGARTYSVFRVPSIEQGYMLRRAWNDYGMKVSHRNPTPLNDYHVALVAATLTALTGFGLTFFGGDITYQGKMPEIAVIILSAVSAAFAAHTFSNNHMNCMLPMFIKQSKVTVGRSNKSCLATSAYVLMAVIGAAAVIGDGGITVRAMAYSLSRIAGYQPSYFSGTAKVLLGVFCFSQIAPSHRAIFFTVIKAMNNAVLFILWLCKLAANAASFVSEKCCPAITRPGYSAF